MHIDLIGQKFGRLTVIKRAPRKEGAKDRGARWICSCECGNETNVRAALLKTGDIKGCGCLWKTGFQDITGTYFGNLRSGALRRKIPFDITIEEAWKKFLQQDRKCALSGIRIWFSPDSYLQDQTASLDRKDGTKGYTLDNVQWVHKTVNRMKMDLSDDDLISWARLIVETKCK